MVLFEVLLCRKSDVLHQTWEVLGDSNHQGFLLIDKPHAASIQVCCVMLDVYHVNISALQ